MNKEQILDKYEKGYNSELVQELMTMNIDFFNIAYKPDQEVFLEAALDSINKIYKKNNEQIIETDLCNIKIKEEQYCIYLASNKQKTINLKFNNDYIEEIKKSIIKYNEKEEIEI